MLDWRLGSIRQRSPCSSHKRTKARFVDWSAVYEKLEFIIGPFVTDLERHSSLKESRADHVTERLGFVSVFSVRASGRPQCDKSARTCNLFIADTRYCNVIQP